MLRTSLAFILILLGSVLTFPASAAIWERYVLMNEGEFVSMGREVLGQPAVQAELTERVAAEAVAVEPRLPSEASRLLARGIVSQLPESALGTEALQRSFTLVQSLIRDEAVATEKDTIVLDLQPVVERIASGLNADLAPAERIQLPPDTGRVVLVQESDLTPVFLLARLFDAVAVYVAIAPLIAYGLAILLAPRRLLTLAAVGASIAVTAGLRIALIDGPLASGFVEEALIAPSARQAALETYDVIAASIIEQEYVLLVIGLAVCIGGMSLAAVSSVARRI